MTKCRVSEDELANDRGDAPEETVSSLDLGHDIEHQQEFFDAILDSDAVINALIKFHRAPSCINGALLKVATDNMLAEITGEV